VIKYLTSLIFLFFLLSCNELNLDNVSDVVENSTNKIEEIIENKKEDKKKKNHSNNKQTNDNIFYYIGEPYFIEGVNYVPEENYNYSEIGLSSFYGKELHNVKTVNNDTNKVTELLGRHKTLPIPSMVKVTNLDNGLSINVKIIDRHDDNRVIIQVSRKIAQLLGFYKSKIATVRVDILSDASKQWKSVANSLNKENFDETISSAPTDMVYIEEIDEIQETNNDIKTILEEPIEIKLEKITNFKLYLKVIGFESYESIRLVLDNYDSNLKYSSEKNNSKYDVIIGPLENTEANNLVSYFISKGYKETDILIE
tara:strand:- start:158 stop:1093 length:936 start_codon:yes stop_codon:yes gene_type:complete